MPTLRLRSLLLLPLLAAGGCATTRAVAPLERGQHGINLSLGGPFVEFAGAPVPVPFTSVGYAYGIDGHTNIHAGAYLTGPIFFGIGGVSLGAAREVLTAQGARPRLMFDFNTHWLWGDLSEGEPDGGFRFFPELQLVATWDLPAKAARRPHRIYLGVDGFFQPFPEFRFLFTPLLGTELRAHDLVGVQIEVQWVAPNENTRFLNPVWIGPAQQGAIAAHLGLNFYLPTKKRTPVARKEVR